MKGIATYFVLVIIALFIFSAFYSPALAQDNNIIGGNGGGNGGVVLENPLQSDSIMGVIDGIIAALQVIAVPIVALALLYGAFQMVFAGGDADKFNNGKKTILYAVVGYVIILIARGISSILENILIGGA